MRGEPFQILDDVVDSAGVKRGRPLKVCFVTSELAELHQNGGIGTATTGLIRVLLKEGFDITVFYTGHINGVDDETSMEYIAGIKSLRGAGVDIFFLQREFPPHFRETRRKVSYACFHFLKTRQFDVIHFNDYGGNGFYTGLAKKTKINFHATTIITTVHGPTLWACSADEEPISSVSQYEQVYLEHSAISYSDVCIGLSAHLLDWLVEQRVSLPEKTFLHKNCQPDVVLRPHEKLQPYQLKRLAFFGRLDQRKGVDVFVKAVEIFAAKHSSIQLSFVGRFSNVDGEHSAAYILNRLGHLRNSIDFISNLDRDSALKELATSGTVAVIPSHDENSPCVVVECQMAGIPFIAADVGGIAELIPSCDRTSTLFHCDPFVLAAKLEEIWDYGLSPIYTNKSNSEIAGAWIKLHHMVGQHTGDREPVDNGNQPLVSVCITHYRRAHFLPTLLRAINDQTYCNIEIILVDDGSNDPASEAMLDTLELNSSVERSLKVLRIENSYLGAARNAAVAQASGKYIKFQDDDNIPLSIEIASLVAAAEATGSDIITCFAYQFSDDPPENLSINDVHYFPLGAGGALSYLSNVFGDANALVSRAVFNDLDGFSEDRGVGCEDYEFYARATSKGHKLICVPEPLFLYRVSPQSMLQTGRIYKNAMRARRGFESNEGLPYLRVFADIELGRSILRERKEIAWYRSFKYQNATLHQQLMDGDPNADDKHILITELLSAYGHIEDAIYYSLRHRSFHVSLDWINSRIHTVLTSRNMENGSRGFPVIMDLRFEHGARAISPIQRELPSSWHPDWEFVGLRDHGLLVHPIDSLITVAALPSAVGRGANCVSVTWLHAHPQGGAAEVSIGIGGKLTLWSEWLSISNEDGPITLAMEFPTLDEPKDLMLRTRAIGRDSHVWTIAKLATIGFAGKT